MTVAPVIDADSHLYETRSLWSEYSSAADREKCLRIEDDELGYAWLTFGRERIEALGIHEPGDISQSGTFRTRMAARLPAEAAYDDMPASFYDPLVRLAALDEFGIDSTILFPNCGIMWERALGGDLAATTVNMAAWNRYAVSVAQSGRGRLHPVGHVTLRELDWLEGQLRALADGGVRTAMVAPGLVDGKRLSHPDLDRAWATFADLGIAPVFHIAQYVPPFDDAWTEGDPDWSNPVLSSVFMWTAPALAIADLATRGVLARYPSLRLGVVELMSAWLPLFLLQLDGGFSFHASFNGRPLAEMDETPSAYVRRQVKVAAFAFEQPAKLTKLAGDIFMFGSDWPHPEGMKDPLADFEAVSGLSSGDSPTLYRDNAAWLLGV